MKILFSVGANYLPQGTGGIQKNTHDICNWLMLHGHQPLVISGLIGGNKSYYINAIKRRFSRSPVVADFDCGYPVYRGWSLIDGFKWILMSEQPDCAILQSENMSAFSKISCDYGLDNFGYFHSTTNYDIDISSVPDFTGVFANSIFMARTLESKFGYQANILRPIIIAENYFVPRTGERVIFFNPHPSKGSELMVEIARRLSHIQFDFVSPANYSWNESSEIKSTRSQVRDFGNVHWHQACGDVRKFFAGSRLLLMPSMGFETWGRVVSEAQVSGIPVLASDRGGLPEAVGAGGVVLSADATADIWCEQISRLYSDEKAYVRLSALAFDHARRADFQPDAMLDGFMKIVEGV
jgi:glycosyltransferase involved in cell wall biosynthesis